MKQYTVHETHRIVHDDYPDVLIDVTVDANYKVLDDGFVVVEYKNVDYPTKGNA